MHACSWDNAMFAAYFRWQCRRVRVCIVVHPTRIDNLSDACALETASTRVPLACISQEIATTVDQAPWYAFEAFQQIKHARSSALRGCVFVGLATICALTDRAGSQL